MQTPPYRAIVLAFRLLLAIVFLLAGASKVTQPWVFVHTVENYGMLPAGVARPFGLALPWVEMLLGLYLLIGLFTRVTAIVTAALLAMFMVALATQLARGGTGIGCGCFSGLNNSIVTTLAGGSTIGSWDLIRDGLLLLVALAVAAAPRPLLAVDAWLAARREAGIEDDKYEASPSAL
jgi:uncharacterized membrane protein YphA (DoxX/SURF4 family)